MKRDTALKALGKKRLAKIEEFDFSDGGDCFDILMKEGYINSEGETTIILEKNDDESMSEMLATLINSVDLFFCVGRVSCKN